MFPILLRSGLIAGGSRPVMGHTEKSCCDIMNIEQQILAIKWPDT